LLPQRVVLRLCGEHLYPDRQLRLSLPNLPADLLVLPDLPLVQLLEPLGTPP
jgi:hypothetical protein